MVPPRCPCATAPATPTAAGCCLPTGRAACCGTPAATPALQYAALRGHLLGVLFMLLGEFVDGPGQREELAMYRPHTVVHVSVLHRAHQPQHRRPS